MNIFGVTRGLAKINQKGSMLMAIINVSSDRLLTAMLALEFYLVVGPKTIHIT